MNTALSKDEKERDNILKRMLETKPQPKKAKPAKAVRKGKKNS